MTTTDNSMEYTERLLSILLIEKNLSADMRIRVEAHAMDMLERLDLDAAGLLHLRLHSDEYTENEVKTLINAFPSALSQLCHYDFADEDGMALTTVVFLPIQAAALRQQDRNCVSFIPLLAEEGHKLNVGGEGQRGGLLAYYTDGLNLLQILACLSPWYYNSFCLHLLKRLRQSQLLKKEDFREYDLLFRSCKPEAEE